MGSSHKALSGPFIFNDTILLCIFFSGEENSRVQAHIDGDEFSAHILTAEAEYNVEVRAPPPGDDY